MYTGSLERMESMTIFLTKVTGHEAIAASTHLCKEHPSNESTPLATEGSRDGAPLVGLPPHQDHCNGTHS